MFISHCHVGAIGFGGEQSNTKVGTLLDLKQILDTVGVEGAVVFTPFPSKGLGWGGKVWNGWISFLKQLVQRESFMDSIIPGIGTIFWLSKRILSGFKVGIFQRKIRKKFWEGIWSGY